MMKNTKIIKKMRKSDKDAGTCRNRGTKSICTSCIIDKNGAVSATVETKCTKSRECLWRKQRGGAL